MLDDQLTVIEANANFARIAGFADPTEVIAHTMLEWIAEDDVPQFRGEIQARFDQGSSGRINVDCRTARGTVLPVEITTARVETREGLHVLCLCRHATERRDWARRLQQQAEFLQTVLESISHPLYVVNAADYSIEMANSAARAMQRAGEGTCHALLHGSAQSCAERGMPCPLAIARSTGKPSIVQHFGLDDRGNVRWLEIQGFPLIKDGKVVKIVEYAFDITERKRIERHVAYAREMAETESRAKSNFLAAVSHDLRTPLNGILGCSEALVSGAIGAVFDERTRDYLQSMRVAGLHLLNLINDVLDFSATQSDKFSLFEERIVPAEIVASSLVLVNGVAENAGVKLEPLLAADMPRLFADERRVKQILVNLLGNAIRYSPRGGTVTLSGEIDRRGGIVFKVADHGVGMDPGQIAAALEPFSRLDNMKFHSKDGTGLGLPLAKRMTEVHGGTLRIRSKPGRGTTVLVRLPKRRTVAEGNS